MTTQDFINKVKQYPFAVGGGLLSLVLLGLLFFTWDRLAQLETEYDSLENEVNVIQRNEINAVGLPVDVARAEAIVKQVNERLMQDDAKAEHYRYFLGLAEKSGVFMSDPRYSQLLLPDVKGASIKTKEFAQIVYFIELTGSFREVIDFLYLLRSGKHFVTLTSLEMQADENVGGDSVRAAIRANILAAIPDSAKKEKKD